jgi:hypothetical protein
MHTHTHAYTHTNINTNARAYAPLALSLIAKYRMRTAPAHTTPLTPRLCTAFSIAQPTGESAMVARVLLAALTLSAKARAVLCMRPLQPRLFFAVDTWLLAAMSLETPFSCRHHSALCSTPRAYFVLHPCSCQHGTVRCVDHLPSRYAGQWPCGWEQGTSSSQPHALYVPTDTLHCSHTHCSAFQRQALNHPPTHSFAHTRIALPLRRQALNHSPIHSFAHTHCSVFPTSGTLLLIDKWSHP